MCGIVGMISDRPVSIEILNGLRRLEYRGYDSAGIATLHPDTNQIDRRRAQGKLNNLHELLEGQPLDGCVGIGHTRWATHGSPTEENAHPHSSAQVSVVHNGIIENFADLREQLIAKGHAFTSDTDSEVIAHLIQDQLDQFGDPIDAVRESLKMLEGAFALGIIFADHPDMIIGARRGSPLAVGFGDQQTDGTLTPMYLGSDAIAISPWTRQICYLEEGDWVVLSPGTASIYDQDNNLVNREIKISQVSTDLIGKGDYRHFMEKEIFEQPSVIGETLNAYLDRDAKAPNFRSLEIDFAKLKRLTIIACGTSFYAGLTAKYWFEQIARLPVECDIASEYRYREAPIGPDEAALFISQSGETSDTLAALRYCRAQRAKIISLVNVAESSMARESDMVLRTLAGPEIGVASTKAFTTQLSVLAALALYAGQIRGTLSQEQAKAHTDQLLSIPKYAQQVLSDVSAYERLGHKLAECRDILFIARGSLYPVAMEGALKLKEISYLHAEGYAAGEMKHGPIALIDENVPVVAMLPSDNLYEKTASNCEEAAARGGRIIAITDTNGQQRVADVVEAQALMPNLDAFIAPILYALPMQLLAYYTALSKGTDVDQPRNLAKSVTVE